MAGDRMDRRRGLSRDRVPVVRVRLECGWWFVEWRGLRSHPSSDREEIVRLARRIARGLGAEVRLAKRDSFRYWIKGRK